MNPNKTGTRSYQNNLLSYMSRVGVGKSGSKDLSREDARLAMEALLTGQFDPVTFGAFFMALRYKTEMPEELAGFLDAMFAAQNQSMEKAFGTADIDVPPNLLTCAGAYNGKSRTLNISLAAALTVAACGVPIILHGARGIPMKYGLTTSHLLEALGINFRPSFQKALSSIHEAGIAYIDQQELNPGLHSLLPCRIQMGKRTIINTMEILSNPFGAKYCVTGFFHDPFATLMGEALSQPDMPFSRAAVVKGIEGSDEIRAGGVFYAHVHRDHYELRPINSDEIGLPCHISQISGRAASLTEQVKMSIDALASFLEAPQTNTSYTNAVVLNAALRLMIAGKATDIDAGIMLAQQAINDGAPNEILEKWKRHSPCTP